MEIQSQILCKLYLKPDQLKYYSQVFSLADPQNTGKLQGLSAVNFLKTSGLPQNILRQIWKLSTPNQQSFLNLNRFCVVLKLIAIFQKGKMPSLKFLNQITDLPKFQGIQLPHPPDTFQITSQEILNYKQSFSYLSGSVGYLNGWQTKQVMERTQLHNEILKKVYLLVDPQLKGVVKEGQFVVVIHILAKILEQKIEPPLQVPFCLKGFLEDSRNFQQEVIVQSVNIFQNLNRENLIGKEEEKIEFSSDSYMSGSQQEKYSGPIQTSVSYGDESCMRDKKEILDALSSMVENSRSEIEIFKQKNQMLEQNLEQMKEQRELILKDFLSFIKKFNNSSKEGEIMILKQEIQQLKVSLHQQSQAKQKLIQINLKLKTEIAEAKSIHQRKIQDLEKKYEQLERESAQNKQKQPEFEMKISNEGSNRAFEAPQQKLIPNQFSTNFNTSSKVKQDAFLSSLPEPSFNPDPFSSNPSQQSQNLILFQHFSHPKSEILDTFGQTQDSLNQKFSLQSSISEKPKENTDFKPDFSQFQNLNFNSQYFNTDFFNIQSQSHSF